MHSGILIWINVQSHFMHAYAILHVQKNIYLRGLGRGGVMWDTIIDVLELLVKCRNITTFYRNRAHQNFFFSDTISFWTINSRRRIHVIINGKVLEHESKAGLFPGSVSLKLNSSMSGILQMDFRRSWKTTNTEWSGLYCFWESVKHLAVSNPSGLLQTRSENWESGSTLVEPGHPARFPSFMLEVDL